MSLSYDYWTGHIGEVIDSLVRALGQHARYHGVFKVGATTNPAQRWRAHQHDGWDRMVVKYRTTSYNYIVQAERALIEHGWNSYAYGSSLNINPGGEGLPQYAEEYFLYFLLN